MQSIKLKLLKLDWTGGYINPKQGKKNRLIYQSIQTYESD